MTREEELDWLRRLRSEIYLYMPIEWLIPMDKALDMVINELEQEPIIDKIRAEITELRDSYEKDNYHDEADALTTALAIYDKYISTR